MSEPRFEPTRKRLELNPEQLAIVRDVVERNHAYYVRNYQMHPGCMWPDELVAEIANALSQRTVAPAPAAAQAVHSSSTVSHP